MNTQPQPASGIWRDGAHLFPVRVYYEDTDLSGIVYHANHLRFMERARSDMLTLLGIDQRAAFEAGEGAYAVADINVRYVAPARLEDALVVETRPVEIGAASIRLVQHIRRADELVAEGRVRVGFIAPDGRPRRQPPAWREAFRVQFASPEKEHR